MINTQQLIDVICMEFQNVSVTNIQSIDDVVNIASQYQDIIESKDLVITHDVIGSISEPEIEETVSIVSPIDDSDGVETEFAFVFNYSLTEDGYEVFADVDYYSAIDVALTIEDSDAEEGDED